MTQPVFMLLMAPTEGGSPAFALFIQLTLIFLIFYWLLIRPQRKEKERHQQMIAALKKGDDIVTVGGVIAKVIHAEEDRLTVKTAEETRLVIERGKVARVLTPDTEPASP